MSLNHGRAGSGFAPKLNEKLMKSWTKDFGLSWKRYLAVFISEIHDEVEASCRESITETLHTAKAMLRVMFQENPDIMDVRPHAGRRLDESSVKPKTILKDFATRTMELLNINVFDEKHYRPQDVYASVLRETKNGILEEIICDTFAILTKEQPLLIEKFLRQDREDFHLLSEASAFRNQAKIQLRARYISRDHCFGCGIPWNLATPSLHICIVKPDRVLA